MAYELAKAYVSVGVPLSGMRSGLAKAGALLRKTIISWKTLFSAGIAGVGAGAGLKWVVQMAAEAETLQTNMAIALGTLSSAKDVIDDINKLSLKTPFTPRELNQVALSLAQVGNEVDQLVPLTRMLAEAAAGSGGDMNELAMALNKVRSLNKMQTEHFNLFSERGVLLKKHLMDILDVTEDWDKVLSSGRINFNHVVEALRRATGEGGMFFGALIENSKTLDGLWSTIKGYIEFIGLQIGSRLLPGIKNIAKELISVLGGDLNIDTLLKKIEAGFSKVSDIITGVIIFAKTNMPLIASVLKKEFELFKVDTMAWIDRLGFQLGEQIKIGLGGGRLKSLWERGGDLGVEALKNTIMPFRWLRQLQKGKPLGDEFWKTTSDYTTPPADLDAIARESARDAMNAKLFHQAAGIQQMMGAKAGLERTTELKVLWDKMSKALTDAMGIAKDNRLIDDVMADRARKPEEEKPKGDVSRLMKDLGVDTIFTKLKVFTGRGLGPMLKWLVSGTPPASQDSPWGGRMGFDQLNNAMQDAMNQESNPVKETNEILKKQQTKDEAKRALQGLGVQIIGGFAKAVRGLQGVNLTIPEAPN